jgi:RNA polymerase sigma-70 factor, ECF subfamily
MDEQKVLAARFEVNRAHLLAVAYRMLGAKSEAEDAVQEAWLRLRRTDARAVDNLCGWLTRVVSRVCLNMLRSRKSRREDALDRARQREIVRWCNGLAFSRRPWADGGHPSE